MRVYQGAGHNADTVSFLSLEVARPGLKLCVSASPDSVCPALLVLKLQRDEGVLGSEDKACESICLPVVVANNRRTVVSRAK
jgi:hypothetical protein